jgi:hypothetical protein
MAELPLDIRDDVTAIGLIPAPVKVFGREAELNDEIAGEVLGFDLAPFFLPWADESRFILTHDDPGVRTSYKVAS